MRKILIIIVSVILMSFNLKKEEKVYSLTIIVNDLRNSEGVVQFAIYNTEGSIPDEKYENYYQMNTTLIKNNSATITFILPKGRYAVNILHDENENGEIEKKSFIPVPKEGVGFSNYKSIGLFNKPKFSKASFELASNLRKYITIIYF